jgi:hypothetical protein
MYVYIHLFICMYMLLIRVDITSLVAPNSWNGFLILIVIYMYIHEFHQKLLAIYIYIYV